VCSAIRAFGEGEAQARSGPQANQPRQGISAKTIGEPEVTDESVALFFKCPQVSAALRLALSQVGVLARPRSGPLDAIEDERLGIPEVGQELE